ncbi:hypothetical protein M422DRAFT_63734 [Sphaerobolus stellatus SS14]|nr:hypothetical protein M422DRAFT_63734 [Sphaerobolus stellatus SS14]
MRAVAEDDQLLRTATHFRLTVSPRFSAILSFTGLATIPIPAFILLMSHIEALVESVPQELWDEIARDLEAEDIGALRLTCKSLQVKLWSLFLNLFKDRKVTLFSPDSLQRLVTIAEHELFGPRVKSVTILAGFYDTAKADGRLKSCKKRVTANNSIYSAECTEEELEEARVDSEFLHQSLADQEHIRSEDTHRKLLTDAFQKLQALTALSFDLIVYNSMANKAPDNTVEWESRDKLSDFTLEALEVGLSAVVGNGVPIQTLSIFDEGCTGRGGLPPSNVQQAIDRLRERHGDDLLPVLSQVRSFKYSFARKGGAFPPLDLLSLVRTQNLEDLGIAFVANEVYYHPLLDRLPSVEFGRLRTLTLDNATISERPLLQFLRKNMTLESVKFLSVMLTGRWKSILKYCCGAPVDDPKDEPHDDHRPNPEQFTTIPPSETLHHPTLRTVILEYIRERPMGSNRHADRVRFLDENFVSVEDFTSNLRLCGEEELRKGFQYTVYAGRTIASAAVVRDYFQRKAARRGG